MIQISLPYIYGLPTSLQPLRNLTEGTLIKESIYVLYRSGIRPEWVSDSKCLLIITSSNEGSGDEATGCNPSPHSRR